jgi:hypothetical protein
MSENTKRVKDTLVWVGKTSIKVTVIDKSTGATESFEKEPE